MTITKNKTTPTTMTMVRRKIFRFIAYILVGICLILLLILYLLYLSAQRLPDFYKKALAVDDTIQRLRNDEMRYKIGNFNNALQKVGESWQAVFTTEDMNAYFAVELAKEGANLLPDEITEPRLAFSERQVDFACQITQSSFSGILHLTLRLTLPEPNRLAIRIKNAKLGKLPISKEIPVKFLVQTLEKKSYSVQQGQEAGDPVITVLLNMQYGKNLVFLDGITFQDGTVHLSGTTEQPSNQE
jgi:hypothetical protein